MNPLWMNYLSFYNHPFIMSIKDNEAWTVSDKNKRPMDIKGFIENERLFGATEPTKKCLTTLPSLIETIPNAVNHTYYINSYRDNFIILDVEKTCPDELKEEFLKLPFIYGETSMSGQGYHLVFYKDDLFENFPDLKSKTKMQDEDRYYEILINHWVTFTRNMIEPPAEPEGSISTWFNKLAENENQKMIDFDASEFEIVDPNDIPEYMFLYENTKKRTNYNKTRSDFKDDDSRYEFGYAGHIVAVLWKMLSLSNILRTGHEYTVSEKAQIAYDVFVDLIPHRSKHDSKRGNVPYLMYIIQIQVQKKEKEQEKKSNVKK